MNNPNENAVGFVEIPVSNMDRATSFYKAIFGYEFEHAEVDGNQMAFFPFDETRPGVSAALTKGDIYIPSHQGAVVYLNTINIDKTLEKVAALGGKSLYPKTSIGPRGFVAEFEDSEGNRIALYEPAP